MILHRGHLWPFLIVVGALLTTVTVSARPAPAPEDVRGKKTEVFNRPEFHPAEPGAGGWLMRQLRNFIHWLGSLSDGAPLLFWLLLIGCVAALAALFVLIAYQLRTVFGGGGRDRTSASGGAAHRLRLSAAHREEAERRAAAGDYTEAVRFLFLSLVYRFDERGRVSFHKEYTNREYLDLVGDLLHVRDALQVLVDTLDDHWYAQRPCGRERYEECLAVYNELLAA